jgi:hypothetical protein
MDIKYQVFVSSTYRDLSEERQEVMQALLELDCIPVGMELFPAADDDQWTLIKRLIDDCDYYILIVGNRYGSLSDSGISYTQMEYEYALSKDIPIISFLHKNPGQISVDKSDKDPGLIQKLFEFKEIVQKKMCRFWESPVDLGSQVSRSLVRLIKDKPRVGWVRATALPSEDMATELLELRKEVERLQSELARASSSAPQGTENLSSGDDLMQLRYRFEGISSDWEVHPRQKTFTGLLPISWNEIFFEISPLMIDESAESAIKTKINDSCRVKIYKSMSKELEAESRVMKNFLISDSDYQTLKIQFRALGMMTESVKKRSIHDKGTYWSLTPFGDTVMTRLRAIRKEDRA